MEAIVEGGFPPGQEGRKESVSSASMLERVVASVSGSNMVEIKRGMEVRADKVYPQKTTAETTERQQRAEELVHKTEEELARLEKSARDLDQSIATLQERDNSDPLIELLDQNRQNIRQSIDALREVSEQQEKETATASRRILELAEKTLTDEKTGIASASGLIESFEEEVGQAIESGDWESLEKTELLFVDMMLFHKGNEVLGTTGFDDRIKVLLNGTKAIARYLASENDLYHPFLPGEAEQDEYLNKYFPVGSKQRERLDQLKEAGVKIQPARINPGGGDEFVFSIRYGDKVVPGGLAREVLDDVIRSTVISETRETALENDGYVLSEKEKEERREIFQAYCNSINGLWVSKDSWVDEIESRRYWTFANGLRGYLMSKTDKYFEEPNGENDSFLDPKYDIRMDYAEARRYGILLPKLSEIDKLLREGSLIGKEGSSEFDEYMVKLKQKVAEKLSEEELKDENILRRAVKEELVHDLLNRFFGRLNDEVNFAGKVKKKMQVVENAGLGDIQSMFTIGAVEVLKRSFGSFNNDQRRGILDDLISYYTRQYSVQIALKGDGRSYDADMLREFSAFIRVSDANDRRTKQRSSI